MKGKALMMDAVPSSNRKAEVNQGRLVWRGDFTQLRADLLASLQQVSKQTWAEAEVAAVKSIRMQRGLEKSLSGLMWDGSG